MQIEPVVSGQRTSRKTSSRTAAAKTVLLILCNSAIYLNILIVILSSPNRVVGPAVPNVVKDSEAFHATSDSSLLHGAGKPESNNIISGSSHDKFQAERPQHEQEAHEDAGDEGEALDEGAGFEGINEDKLLERIRHQDRAVEEHKETIKQHGVTEANRLHQGMKNDFPPPEEAASWNAAQREHRLTRWWSGIVNFWRSIFRRKQWKQDKLYLQLKTLRSRIEEDTPKEVQKAINRLSILEYKGFEFSKEEVKLTNKLSGQMKRKSFQLDQADQQLINQIGWKKVVGRKVEEIDELLKVYTDAISKSRFRKRYVNKYKEALENLRPMLVQDVTRWNPEYTKLTESIRKLKDGPDFPKNLAELDPETEQRLALLDSEKRRIQKHYPQFYPQDIIKGLAEKFAASGIEMDPKMEEMLASMLKGGGGALPEELAHLLEPPSSKFVILQNLVDSYNVNKTFCVVRMFIECSCWLQHLIQGTRDELSQAQQNRTGLIIGDDFSAHKPID
ncbi:hypothetical protein PGT21_025202 [Puccinia graminis f. sp. tritici]|uniref:Uncharacterized protein n=1 Tax=Puccinia graminis f. sp. tritici TaxID=56615 RepID=A0A5B0PT81_PUCGR|nr:hypothetical protein PGT21_025202 [Puccinia graminis f. sp. tritici]